MDGLAVRALSDGNMDEFSSPEFLSFTFQAVCDVVSFALAIKAYLLSAFLLLVTPTATISTRQLCLVSSVLNRVLLLKFTDAIGDLSHPVEELV